MYKPKHMKAPETLPDNTGATAWDMSDVEFQQSDEAKLFPPAEESSPAETKEYPKIDSRTLQERKIISAIAYGKDGHINANAINAPYVEPPQSAWDKVMDGLADGTITSEQKRELIASVPSPAQIDGGLARVQSELDDMHELRILGFLSAGASGFQNYQNLSIGNLTTFINRYPNPMDFEHQSEAFLDLIERNNGIAKRQEYETAMESFKGKIYGEQYDYWKRLKSLEVGAQARRRAKMAGQNGSLQDIHYPRTGDVMDATSPNLIPVNKEFERSSEWISGQNGYQQLSRSQTMNDIRQEDMEKAGLWADGTCEDALLVNEGQSLFGVFDGAGGYTGGRNASQLASQEVNRFCQEKGPITSGRDLAKAINRANDAIVDSDSAGYSTASVVKFIDGSVHDGTAKLAYASVGDSRIYIIGRNGEVKQVVNDEGTGHVITNALGMKREGVQSRVKQFGEVDIHDGDRLVLCTDGITGDYGDDIMENAELASIVQKAYNPQNAATALAARARKHDDRTVFVTQFELAS